MTIKALIHLLFHWWETREIARVTYREGILLTTYRQRCAVCGKEREVHRLGDGEQD